MDNLWNYDPDAGWADYGDANFLGFDDVEIEEIGVSQYRKPLELSSTEYLLRNKKYELIKQEEIL